jgi:hypothetical protein
MNRLPDVQGAVGSALVSLGDGNWKMGEGVQVGKGAKPGEGDEQTVLEHFLGRFSQALPSYLTMLCSRCYPNYAQLTYNSIDLPQAPVYWICLSS